MSDPITVLSYDPVWSELFRQLGAQLRAALNGVALRIDHIQAVAHSLLPSGTMKPIVASWKQIQVTFGGSPRRSPP